MTALMDIVAHIIIAIILIIQIYPHTLIVYTEKLQNILIKKLYIEKWSCKKSSIIIHQYNWGFTLKLKNRIRIKMMIQILFLLRTYFTAHFFNL